MDTQNDPLTKFEFFKQEVTIASENMFKVAENALSNNPKLKKVIILDRIQRFDKEDVDPYRLKSQLSKLGNSCYLSLLSQSKFKNQIFIGHHNLQSNKFTKNQVFGSEHHPLFDGITTTPFFGKKAYSQSLCDILYQYDVLKEKIIVPIQQKQQISSKNNSTYINNWQRQQQQWQHQHPRNNQRNSWQHRQQQQQQQQSVMDSKGFSYNIPTSNPYSPISEDWYNQVVSEEFSSNNQGNW